MLAALLAALMSSLTSILNSASSIMTMDLWRQFRKTATQSELMIVGRVTVLVLVIVSILWLPILKAAEGGVFWFYIQAIRSYLIPPMCVLFILGLFWKRLTEQVSLIILKEKFGGTEGVVKMRKSKTDKQYNDQKIKFDKKKTMVYKTLHRKQKIM